MHVGRKGCVDEAPHACMPPRGEGISHTRHTYTYTYVTLACLSVIANISQPLSYLPTSRGGGSCQESCFFVAHLSLCDVRQAHAL